MTDKARALEAIQRLPEDATPAQILAELEFIAAVQEGLDDARAGRVVSLDEVEKKIEQWLSRSS